MGPVSVLGGFVSTVLGGPRPPTSSWRSSSTSPTRRRRWRPGRRQRCRAGGPRRQPRARPRGRRGPSWPGGPPAGVCWAAASAPAAKAAGAAGWRRVHGRGPRRRGRGVARRLLRRGQRRGGRAALGRRRPYGHHALGRVGPSPAGGGVGGAAEVAGRLEALGGVLGHRARTTASSSGGRPGTERRGRGRRVVEVRPHLRLVGVARERHVAGERVVRARSRARRRRRARRPARRGSARARCSRACPTHWPVCGQAAALGDALGQRRSRSGRRARAARSPSRMFAGLTSRWTSPRGVGGVERAGDLGDDRGGARRRPAGPWRREHARAGPALDEAHRDVEPAVVLAGLVDRDHVRVVDASPPGATPAGSARRNRGSSRPARGRAA